MVVGAIIQCSSFGLPQFIVGRVVTGLGNGMVTKASDGEDQVFALTLSQSTSTIPMWQAETAKAHHRGQMVMIEAFLVIFGVALSSYVDLGFSFLDPSSISW